MAAAAQPVSSDEALRRLADGNARFVRGAPIQRLPNPDALARLADAQYPFATILGCSDSRVSPEIVFDQGLGDLFIVRVAGNVVGAEVLGSLGYALAHLATPLFVILGHEGCGAVQAALRIAAAGSSERGKLAELLDAILPALSTVDRSSPPAHQMLRAVEANVRWAMRSLAATPAGREAIAGRRTRLVGAVYELATGHVRFLPDAPAP